GFWMNKVRGGVFGTPDGLASVLARSRTWAPTFAGLCANPSHSEDKMEASIPARIRTGTRVLGKPDAVRYTTRTTARADGWIRTSMLRLTRSAPFCFEPRRQKSRSARIRTLSRGVGGRLLSQEHAPNCRVRLAASSNG